mgnify:FL=1
MALTSRVKILGSKEARTQYLTLSASLTDDSQYAFKAGDEAYITVIPDTKLLLIAGDQVRVDHNEKEGIISIYLKEAPQVVRRK